MGRAVLLLAATGLLLAQPETIVFTRLGPSQTRLFVPNADRTAERPLLNADSTIIFRGGPLAATSLCLSAAWKIAS